MHLFTENQGFSSPLSGNFNSTSSSSSSSSEVRGLAASKEATFLLLRPSSKLPLGSEGRRGKRETSRKSVFKRPHSVACESFNSSQSSSEAQLSVFRNEEQLCKGQLGEQDAIVVKSLGFPGAPSRGGAALRDTNEKHADKARVLFAALLSAKFCLDTNGNVLISPENGRHSYVTNKSESLFAQSSTSLKLSMSAGFVRGAGRRWFRTLVAA